MKLFSFLLFFSIIFSYNNFKFNDNNKYEEFDTLYKRYLNSITDINKKWKDITHNDNNIAYNEIIGKSILENDLFSIKIGNCSIENIPSIIFTGLHHAREGPSTYVIIGFLEYISYMLSNNNEEIITLLKTRCLVTIPIVNPDSYDINIKAFKTTKKYGFKRKNQRRSCNGTCDYGVDLNRNYGICFNNDNTGSSKKPAAEDYQGESAFSEPETQAVKHVMDNKKFTIAINYHSYGKYFIILL